ncbi:2-succinyl-5-enolpyruvyl-6-hydroxy-3-cyclohexene-1-carboxylic-acid synthase [Brevibacterium sp. BRM-1]|uniref:2-succinyl-5-enolpyruvyl-6-hydroxy-3- cyclohexene-1-carboxylic-acid synthase n=1 Tax=Brevibacterium sp. BRM-1 TaxID=2999062 RepID=UPI00227E2273|nr:2-succinyl-5-enolpyruvyl-6-hydroxy-3-cyclohexene-1-carboxylic-acid synthase [Brevibacterium sp. BRM-1]WAL41560.1 2-succinyl-5-enolpyruvyl-6-hydroxy-3-cyclohexene-1-carboxylic-acid synthase [Brevibacterium sp. BRM-1]
MNDSTALARALVSALLGAGVRHAVISPGSRSAPLAYALAAADAAGALTAHVRIDERDAAFLALGIAKGERAAGRPPAPVAVVTTSGSAVANLHPAALEAAYAHLPLLLLTADRPARLRGTGANQTLDAQHRALPEVRAALDVPAGTPGSAAEALVAQALTAALGTGLAAGRPPGPVQLNVQFDVPLEPTADDPPFAVAVPAVQAGVPGAPVGASAAPVGASAALDAGFLTAPRERAVILAGDAFGWSAARAAAFADATGLPVLAEPTSALRELPGAVPAHAEVLAAHPELTAEIRTVFSFGKVTLFRPDARLLAAPGVAVHRIQADLDAVSPGAWEEAWQAAGAAAGLAPDAVGLRWAERWRAAGAPQSADPAEQDGDQREQGTGLPRAAQPARTEQPERTEQEEPAAARPAAEPQPGAPRPLDPAAAVRAIAAAGGELFAASSSAVRYLDRVPTSGVRLHASRGLAGIDGLISTAAGAAMGLGLDPELDAPLRLVIGDVAALHDVGGLLRESGEAPPHLQVFVLNDDGGAIFAGLEHGQPHLRPFFDRYFGTRHGRTFEHLARAYGWHYERCADAAAIASAAAAGRPGVYEIPLPPVGG